jgi:hypothetical protein
MNPIKQQHFVKKTISGVDNLTGFVIDDTEAGENTWILQRAKIDASDQHFYMFMNQLDGHFLRPAGIKGDSLTHFLALLHSDGKADIYTHYSQVRIEMKPKRNIAKGDPVYVSDIDDVRRYEIEGVDFMPGDAVVCVMKVGWKYGLFFDFTRSIASNEVWQQLGQLYNSLHVDRIIENIQSAVKESEKPHIITEGKTDWKHLEAARRKIAPELAFGYPSSEDTLGDIGLLQMCERLSKFGPQNKNKIIAIFDRDNPATLNKLKEHGDLDGYQTWGKNIYSFAIPFPRERKAYKHLCIELLYSDIDLTSKDSNGKRLFFNNEIRTEVIAEKRTRILAIKPIASMEHDKKVFDGLADQIEDKNGKKVGLSKALFAQYALDQTDGFGELDFAGFEETIKTIKDILRFDPTANDPKD